MKFKPIRKDDEHVLTKLMLDAYSKYRWRKILHLRPYALENILADPIGQLTFPEMELIAQALKMPLYSVIALLQGFTLDEI